MGTEEQSRWLEQGVGVRRLDDHVLVRILGDDARSWLQGQITNDIGTPSPGQATYAMIVAGKGRVMTDLWVWDEGEKLSIVLPATVADAVLAHLDRYIIMEDVEFERPAGLLISAQGPRAADVFPKGWPVDRLGSGGREIWSDDDTDWNAALARAADAGGGAVEEQSWELTRLRHAIPAFGIDFGDWTYPQETGLAGRAVSFSKGCYVGQEAVVMLEHRGKPPKRMCVLRSAAPPAELRGADVLVDEAHAVGQITSAVADKTTTMCLALLRRDHARVDGTCRAGSYPLRIERVLE